MPREKTRLYTYVPGCGKLGSLHALALAGTAMAAASKIAFACDQLISGLIDKVGLRATILIKHQAGTQ
jgi:hypothetical protein